MIAPHYADGPVTLYAGDCIEVMRQLADASVDSVVTDPPYALDFMGHGWDRYAPGEFQHWCEVWATEALRILKPGGHLLAFGGTRTFHRLAAGVEDAGFEIRDSIAWLYGSGFPKSLDVSKAIDKQLGTEGTYGAPKSAAHAGWVDRGRMRGTDTEGHEGYQRPWMKDQQAVDRAARKYEGGSEDAQRWAGWGTALKPAFEPVVVARKPLIGTVAANVLAYGTGALNIDESRIGTSDVLTGSGSPPLKYGGANSRPFHETAEARGVNQNPAGRWPANVVLDVSQAAALDQQSGQLTSGKMLPTHTTADRAVYGQNAAGGYTTGETYGDRGGASRFFYTAKAPGHERPEVDGTSHPTVKPLDLMQWLVRLVTPKGGTVLEPFAGSGTTVEACLREGFSCIAIERETDYLPLILKRVRKDHAVGFDFGDWDGAAV